MKIDTELEDDVLSVHVTKKPEEDIKVDTMYLCGYIENELDYDILEYLEVTKVSPDLRNEGKWKFRVEVEQEDPKEEEIEQYWEQYTVDDLDEMLDERGLSKTGHKEEKIVRILKHDGE